MTTITIDTLKANAILKEHGYSDKQAEGFISVFQNIDLDAVASKNDVKNATADIRGEIANLRSEMYKIVAAQTLIIIAAVVGILQLVL